MGTVTDQRLNAILHREDEVYVVEEALSNLREAVEASTEVLLWVLQRASRRTSVTPPGRALPADVADPPRSSALWPVVMRKAVLLPLVQAKALRLRQNPNRSAVPGSLALIPRAASSSSAAL